MGNRLVWIEEELAGKLEILNDVVKLNRDKGIDELIKSIEADTKIMSDSLDENALQFKLHAQKVRSGYEAVVQEELDKTYELWEKCEELRKQAKEKTKEILPMIESASKHIENLKSKLSSLDIYGLDRIFDLVNKFNSMSKEDKELLSKMFSIKSE
jgi:ribosomal protein L14E/L6E/L27E